MRTRQEVRGQSTLEYVLVFAVIAVALIAALNGVGGLKAGVSNVFNGLGTWLGEIAGQIPTKI